MFGSKQKQFVPSSFIFPETLTRVREVLEQFGLDWDHDYGFAFHINSAASYMGGAKLEWTIREAGVRFIISARNGQVSSIVVMNHDGESFTSDQLFMVNRELEDILSYSYLIAQIPSADI